MTDFDARVAQLAADRHAYEPRIYRNGEELCALVRSGEVASVSDEIRLQLAELVQARSIGVPLKGAALDERIEQQLAGTSLADYGSWVHYPWAKRLVHVLPKDEFRFLRTNRNQNKITAAEQAKLAALTVGVVGLSVGQATAITLALEGVGGAFRLADFDHLGVSNMNRMRVGVHSLGVNKAVMTAREIFEIDPYASVKIFPAGIDDANLDEFLNGLDLLFEECDDLAMKVLLRVAARKKRIAVLMETSDRGMLDVERFDLEPDRPLFHGMTRELDPAKLKNLTTNEKIPIVYELIGRTLSSRSVASLVDIDTTISTWPQLASSVALGAALNTDAARRIALGTFTQSGRFVVDLEEIVADGRQAPALAPLSDDDEQAQAPFEALPRLGHGIVDADVARALVGYGVLAPSGGNCQPWRFVHRNGALACVHDAARSASLLDFQNAGSFVAFGALARNMELAAAGLGLEARVTPFPDGPAASGGLVCTVETVRAGRVPDAPLARWIAARVTNRRHGPPVPFDDAHRRSLEDAAARAGAKLQLLEGDALDEIGAILGEGDRVRFLSERMHREMTSELRWSREEANRTRDGLELATLELGATDRIGIRIGRDAKVMRLLREMDAGHGLGTATRKAVRAASAVGLLTIEGEGAKGYFAGGRAMQDVWLQATAHGVAFQPVTALLYMFARLERGGGEGFTTTERAELQRLRRRYRQLFDLSPNDTEVMLFRVAYAGPPSARSLRRKVDDVLTFT